MRRPDRAWSEFLRTSAPTRVRYAAKPSRSKWRARPKAWGWRRISAKVARSPLRLSVSVENFLRLKSLASWKKVAEVVMPFETHHPQGIYKRGEDYFLTTV